MFTKKDYLAYFDQLHQVETAMLGEAASLARIIDLPEAKEIITHIMRDEQRHMRLVDELKELI